MLESNTDASTLDMSVRIRCWDCGCDRKAGCHKYGRGERGGCLHALYDVHTLQVTSRRRSQLVSRGERTCHGGGQRRIESNAVALLANFSATFGAAVPPPHDCRSWTTTSCDTLDPFSCRNFVQRFVTDEPETNQRTTDDRMASKVSWPPASVLFSKDCSGLQNRKRAHCVGFCLHGKFSDRLRWIGVTFPMPNTPAELEWGC
jgi:hypothetical protein